jgi:cysteinyl-tRNA synthetase
LALRLFNTLGREIQEFAPIHPPEVGMYTCGPTVYNYAHIGNLRMYLIEDTLRRVLEFLGYRVTHVMNVTDVGHLTDDADQGEDKMLEGARREGKSVWDIAEYYTRAFFEDLAKLNIEPPTVVARATDHIEDMIGLIRRIERAGYTYFAGGNLYFDISKMPGYGKLAGLDVEGLQAGARIEIDPNKRNPLDFVLWFTRSKFERQAMIWDSPWGRGYPGWHIECSAMSMKYLGERFDIHCGGVDHIPVHHTNEIAQSEAAIAAEGNAATGGKWVNYWVHGEFLVLEKEKMAKSSGQFLTLSRLIEQGYDPMDYRFFCLGAHYRSQLQFSYEALDAARNGRSNLVERIARLKLEAASASAVSPGGALRPGSASASAAAPAPLEGRAGEYLQSFTRNVSDDLHTPRALADLWGLLKEESLPPADRLAVLLEMDRVLGLGLAGIEPEDRRLDEEVRRLIEEREQARRRKDFRRADEIRRNLKERGILLEDTPAGTHWRRESSREK